MTDWWGRREFLRLLGVRALSQSSDGVFQVMLAGYVVFSPERAASPGAVAAGFALLLLPFSVLGPFVGVFLDRWSRQRVLLHANVFRAHLVVLAAWLLSIGSTGWLVAVVLVLLSVNRFLLAGFSAALPHTVPRARLVEANAVTPTLGTLAFLVGVGVGSVLQLFSDGVSPWLVALLYLAAAGVAAGFSPSLLGPDQLTRRSTRSELSDVIVGLVAGLAHLRRRPVAAHALTVVTLHRFLAAFGTMLTLLVVRHHLHGNSPDDVAAAFRDLSLIVAVAGFGFLLAALATPVMVHRLGRDTWVTTLLTVAALAQLWPASTFTLWGLAASALPLGLAAQGVKAVTDATVQAEIDDVFRGRVFAIYDVCFNVAFVSATALAAWLLPADGHSLPALILVALGYLVLAAVRQALSRSGMSVRA